MTFSDKYRDSQSWHEKVIIMELFHLTRLSKGRWNVTKTSDYFHVSVSLVSENLKLAKFIHTKPELVTCKTRTEALIKLREME